MTNNDPADHGGRRYEAEHGAQITATYIQHLDSLEESLLQAIRDMYRYTGPASNTGAPIMLMYTVIKMVRQELIFNMGRQDINPRLRLVYAIIAVALGCVSGSLLMCIMLGDMPWLIFIPCILMLIPPSSFEPED